MAANIQDLFNIQPQRVNADLKRDMSRRMGKLERRTNEAIATIFRQRLQAQRKGDDGPDLLAGISAAQRENDDATREDSDDE